VVEGLSGMRKVLSSIPRGGKKAGENTGEKVMYFLKGARQTPCRNCILLLKREFVTNGLEYLLGRISSKMWQLQPNWY
jgi:hypothetical protein